MSVDNTRKMKDSGVAWIGEVPLNWEIHRNKDAFTCSKILVGEESKTIQLLSLTTKGIKKKDIHNAEGKLPESFDTYQKVKSNDLVMCLFDLDVSAVFSGLSPIEGMISPAYRVLTCSHRMHPQYADYWFQYIGHGRKFNHYAKNIRYTLSYEDFASLPMLFPPIDKQKRIADYLDDKVAKIDAAIAKQKQVIEKLELYSDAMVLEFVTGRNILDQPKTDSMEDWIGSLPNKWECCQLGRVASVVRGASPRPAGDPRYFGGTDIPWITVSEVTNGYGKYITSTESFLTKEGAKQSRIVGEGTLLLSNSGATLGVPRITLLEGCINDGSVAFYDLRINKDYLLYVLRARTHELRRQMQGYGQPNLNTSIIKSIKIPVPPKETQKTIVDYLDKEYIAIENAIEQRKRLIGKLMNYKKSIVFETVTGKREVL